jgi:HD-GYP domain-containing protein (c-di-GMP phosphodiesterase class II)
MDLDAYDTPDAERQLSARDERLARHLQSRRELIANSTAAAGFLVAATLLAVLAPWHGSLSVLNVALVLGVWVSVERVKFPVASYWTYPTMLAFVPALFLLPTPVVPLIAMVAVTMRGVPGMLRGRVSARMLPTLISDSWFTFGPALVIVLAGAEHFAWSHWPVYVAALLAEVAIDLVAALIWAWVESGTSSSAQLPLLAWTWAVDVSLFPLGLVIAAVAVPRPGLIVLALSPATMLLLFARERQQRIDQTQALSTAYRGTALLLGDVVEADDHYTGTHSRDVVDLSLAVADALGLSSAQRRDVEFAALLHDVGKIQVPKHIINKRGPLDGAEWEIVRAHTINGEKMLKQVGGTLSHVGRIVRSSHERYDGEGYPDGLAGEAIPIEARIVTVCDSFSAMTTTRPYRVALTLAQALAELQRCSRTQFDPVVVDALVRLLVAPSRKARERPQLESAFLTVAHCASR